MGYVKLNDRILNSSLWLQRDNREIFITALLMARPIEIPVPVAQLEVDALRETGFMVPPGRYGFVSAAGVGIIRQAGLEQAAGLEALRQLGSPEPESRSQDFDGRRMVRVDGGYLILNFFKFREWDDTNAERQQRWRDKQKGGEHLPALGLPDHHGEHF